MTFQGLGLGGGRLWVWLSVFFLYGASIHWLLSWAYISWAYPPSGSATFVRHPLTKLALSILAGVSVAYFFWHLLRALRDKNRPSVDIVLQASVYGVLATFLALEAFYVATSLIAASLASAYEVGFFVRFLGYFMGIQTFGTIPILYSVPFALAYGAIGGFGIVFVCKYLKAWG